MSPSEEPLKNARWERFAQLLAADGFLGPAYIKAGYAKRGAKQSANRLLHRPEIAARVEFLRRRINQSIERNSVAEKSRRVDTLVRDFELLDQVRRERSLDPDIQRGPGGKTGLVCRTLKMLGGGELGQIVEEFAIDRAWLAEARAYRELIARELGQLIDKRETRLIRSLDDLSDEELASIAAERQQQQQQPHAR